MADVLIDRVGKNRSRDPIYGGMLVTKLARSYGIFDAREASFLIEVIATHCSCDYSRLQALFWIWGLETMQLPMMIRLRRHVDIGL